MSLSPNEAARFASKLLDVSSPSHFEGAADVAAKSNLRMRPHTKAATRVPRAELLSRGRRSTTTHRRYQGC